jgi:hypothetical protein
MLQKVSEFSKTSSTRSVNQHTSRDYEAVAVAWNHDCAAELEKPLSEPGITYQAFSQCASTILNSRATSRQPVLVERGYGSEETFLLYREARHLRQYWLSEDMVPKKLSFFVERHDICDKTFKKVRLPYMLSNLLCRC